LEGDIRTQLCDMNFEIEKQSHTKDDEMEMECDIRTQLCDIKSDMVTQSLGLLCRDKSV